MSKIIEVKTLPEFFWAQALDLKPFEVRYNDRDYRVGDILWQREWSPYGGYTGRALVRSISYVLADPAYCKEGFVVLGLCKLPPVLMEKVKVLQGNAGPRAERHGHGLAPH